ncbi:MAG TPA: hypothetical protein VFC42_02025 [Methylomirabilota bacterium]|nr:hypothetical protein [Methylomirabilota bacterium]
MLASVAEFGRTLLFLLAGVVLVGALAHGLGWLLARRRTAEFVWEAWNLLGAGLLAAGVAAIGYGWWGLGLHSGGGNLLLGVGVLLASAGIWMLVPI